MNNALISFKHVSIRRDNKQLLENISFDLQPAAITTVIGPNGAGKTTLIKALLGLVKPNSGHIQIKPEVTIGYMPQKLHLDLTLPLTVKDFLRLTPTFSQQDFDYAVTITGVDSLLLISVHVLSGGEWQRVLLAKALLRRPQLLILDEPAQGVDINGQTAMYKLINEVRQELACSILMVSHDLHLVMASTDHVICLNKHICCSGSPNKVSNDPIYRDLFGDDAPTIAHYTHHHDHNHDFHGNITPNNSE